MLRFTLAAGAALAALTGCAAREQSAAQAAPSANIAYAKAAASSNLYEIRSSQLALTRAMRPEVRGFAAMLVQHHTAAGRRLGEALAESGAMLTEAELLPTHERMLQTLRERHPAFFDKPYLSQQIRAHESALASHRSYAESGTSSDLRKVATSMIPLDQGHLDRARELSLE